MKLIDKAKRLYESANDDQKHVLESLFPELKESESEDETIRKDIISHLQFLAQYCSESMPDVDKWIAWLEKQSIQQIRTGLEWVNTIDDACDKRYSEEYTQGEYCHKQSFKWGFQEGVDWLEKQGEQKSAWSEEDEQIILSIEQVMNCASLLNIVPEKMDKIRTWLKSLKQRIGK